MKTISVFLVSILLLGDIAWLCGGQANDQDLFSHFFPGMGKKSDFSGTSTSAHAEASTSVKAPPSGRAADVEGKGDVSTQTKSIITTSARTRHHACKGKKCESKEEAEAAIFETESPSKGKPIHVDEAKEASSFSTIKSKSIDFEALKRKYFVHEEDDDFPDFTT